MKFLLSLFYFLVTVSCDCPSFYGNLFSSAEFTRLGQISGFQITVTCPSIATGINYRPHGANGQIGLYADSSNHPGTIIAISTPTANSNGITTTTFDSPVRLSPGNYWILIPGGSGIVVVGVTNAGVALFTSSLEDDLTEIQSVSIDLSYDIWMNVSLDATPCEADWECASSGVNYDFATCEDGFCSCQSNFDGSAVPQDPCTCNNVLAYDQNGNPFCLNDGVCQVGDLVRTDLCNDFTENYMFIECNNGNCQCVDGFQGSATESDQCRCDFTLTWTENGPVCSQ